MVLSCGRARSLLVHLSGGVGRRESDSGCSEADKSSTQVEAGMQNRLGVLVILRFHPRTGALNIPIPTEVTISLHCDE